MKKAVITFVAGAMFLAPFSAFAATPAQIASIQQQIAILQAELDALQKASVQDGAQDGAQATTTPSYIDSLPTIKVGDNVFLPPGTYNRGGCIVTAHDVSC